MNLLLFSLDLFSLFCCDDTVVKMYSIPLQIIANIHHATALKRKTNTYFVHTKDKDPGSYAKTFSLLIM